MGNPRQTMAGFQARQGANAEDISHYINPYLFMVKSHDGVNDMS